MCPDLEVGRTLMPHNLKASVSMQVGAVIGAFSLGRQRVADKAFHRQLRKLSRHGNKQKVFS